MSIDEVKATISRGSEAARDGAETLQRVATNAAETVDLARRTTHDSQDEDVSAGLKLLASIDGETERTIRRLRSAAEHADSYLRGLG